MFKEALFAQPTNRAIEPVETSAGRTYVRALNLEEKDEFDLATEGGKKHVRAQLLIACCCREDGSLEFTEYDLSKLNQLPAHVAEPIIDAAMRLNRFSAEDREALRKNSSSDRNASSSSGSP